MSYSVEAGTTSTSDATAARTLIMQRDRLPLFRDVQSYLLDTKFIGLHFGKSS